ncbi:uncharacterized protein UDID_19654 [Ustilago sp. UG-2017a]|nr:uncharacterized protein UDID_19654 [Ustilago sp. UG-2017a]
MASTDPRASTGDPLVATHELLHPVEMQPPPSPATNLPCVSAPAAAGASPSAASNSAQDLRVRTTWAIRAPSFLSSVATASTTPGSPAGPAHLSTSDPAPDLGADTNLFVMVSLLEARLQSVASDITWSIMDPLCRLKCHVALLAAAVSGSPTSAPTAASARSLEAPHLPTLTPTSALPVDPLPAPNNPAELSVHCLFPWIPTETVNAVYKDLLSVMGLDAQEIGMSEVEITNHARICSKHDHMTDSAEISGKDGHTANFTCKGDQALPRTGPSSEACSWSPLRVHKMKTRRTIAGWRKKSCVKDTGE